GRVPILELVLIKQRFYELVQLNLTSYVPRSSTLEVIEVNKEKSNPTEKKEWTKKRKVLFENKGWTKNSSKT
ncbi:hypothetical protein BpHYR1_035743, partial [Brachionus plicatilis]